MARNLLAFAFVLAFTKAIVETWKDPHWWLIAPTIDLERSLRMAQALAIVALVVLFLFYSIPFGRNLTGVLLGYGLFNGAGMSWFTFRFSFGGKFRPFWTRVHPAFSF